MTMLVLRLNVNDAVVCLAEQLCDDSWSYTVWDRTWYARL